MVHQKEYFWCFCIFVGINSHNFAKIHPIFEKRACFIAVMELYIKYFFNYKKVVWGLEPKS